MPPQHRTRLRGIKVEEHPVLDGTPCDSEGYDLPKDAPLFGNNSEPVFDSFESRAHFKFTEFLFTKVEMSGGNIDELANHLAALYPDKEPPFADHHDMYAHIDSIPHGEVAWGSFSVQYNGQRPSEDDLECPAWMTDKYEVWFRDPVKVLEGQISNPEFKGKLDYAPKQITFNGKRRYKDLMSGNWSWDQADKIAEDPETHGAMFVPVILGSDKTTVSVATGQNDYYPLYTSIGNIHNSVRRAHKNGLSLVGFLAIPKTSREFADKGDFRKFRRQLFHSSLEHILSSLRPHMSKPRITRCADGHLRRVIYGLGPYIADYPEQALLACVVQGWCPKAHIHTHTLVNSGVVELKELWDDYGIVGDLTPFTMNFPRADIHELLAPDLLHQIIKGTFKDHLVDWVEKYIKTHYVKSEADKILADIDRRIAVVPSFPGLRHFHEGRGFKQWTGNDSKGLMKVYLPAIAGHVPKEMVQAVAALIDFCYLVRRDVIDEDALDKINETLSRFHHLREIFRDLDIRPDGFSLPRQHSLIHYPFLITQFGAPNGLCSSITESKHIKAVKRPYRRSSRNKALGQMLVTNQRLDKLAAARTYFNSREYFSSSRELRRRPPITPQIDDDRDDVGVIDSIVEEPESLSEISLARTHVRNLPQNVYDLARHVQQQDLPVLLRRFLYQQLHPDSNIPATQIPNNQLPLPSTHHRIHVYNSARAVFYAPSDLSGLGGLRHERIRSTKSWYGGPARRDCVFIGNSDSPDAPGMRGLLVARVLLFFSFTDKEMGLKLPCALIHWYSLVGDVPCEETGMWMVQSDYRGQKPLLEVIHLDTILRGAHIIGAAGSDLLPDKRSLTFHMSLDAFKTFYVNKYIDHQAHEIAF
ncbi:hypothetical protein CPB83DRAFT_920826 [Crepidotus variabilis]|uniref:Uncharacterized protein n=1 Tax=Crepidotus variabilis TaxID=179855 RepID=A0A9P6EJB6_9AGAR|nr:hypothetical protein CPB83DRAFT_920826 [Crepidotus variabilis]